MMDAICHRGPDDQGQWLDPRAGIALGHRRLSIIDLTPSGHQPMLSNAGRYVLTFNGEIYNFRELRTVEEQHGARFRGRSDTEVLLAAIERRGLDEALHAAAGMFAIALWDREAGQLHLVRDRLGEKPLYYGWSGDTLLFGSELKTFGAYPAWNPVVDRQSLTMFFRFAYVPGPRSIYRDVHKVAPGHIVTLTADRQVRVRAYWSLADVVAAGLAEPLRGSEDEIVTEVERELKATVKQEMVADVPLGAFLSGGIDSTTIAALMQAQSRRPVRTFTIGFHETGYDEAAAAKRVARHLGTEHTELYVTPDEARAVIPRLPTLFDEPFGDPSQIPTFLVAQMARRHVTVALSGDGGDEAFGGYSRYFLGRMLWRCLSPWPRPLLRLSSRAIRRISPEAWQRVLDVAQRVLPARHRVMHGGDRIHKLAGVLAAESAAAMYRMLASHWQEPSELVLGGQEDDPLAAAGEDLPGNLSPVEYMMAVDARTYLPDDIMVKVDRATMGVGLEARAPFLDHRVVELAARVPLAYKLRNGQGKWLLRRVLDRHVPRALVERPKMGFGVPIDEWLRGPLREWAADLLCPSRLQREGFLSVEPIQRKWQEHLSGRRNWQHLLWDVLMFEAWLDAR